MKKILLILCLIGIVVLSAFALTGTYTTNGYFYLPGFGAHGTDEFDEYNAYMQIADTQIEANKDNLLLRYLKTEVDTQGEVETIWGVTLATDSEIPTNVTSFVEQTAWRLFYSNTDGDITELALGANNTYLKSNGATSAPTFGNPDITDKLLWIYPQDYATGTGTSIDPWAGNCITDAYTAANAGDTIYLRKGYYTLESLLNIEGKRVNLIGEGIGNTFIVTSMVNTHAIRVLDNYVTLKGFTLDADSQELNQNRIGIRISGADYLRLEDIEVKNAGYAGIEYADNDYSIFRNLYLHDNAWHGCHSSHTEALEGRHNIYQNIYSWGHTHQGFDEGIPGTAVCNNIYDNINCWDNDGDGLNFYTIVGGNITNCSTWDNGDWGIQIYGADGLSVSDSSFSFNDGYGIRVKNSSDVSLTNVISKNNLSLSGMVVEGSTGVRLANCQFYDDKGTPVQDYAIISEGTCSIEAIGCKLSPNEVGKIYIDGTLTINTIDGVVDGYAAVAGDIMYHNGTNWIRLAKGTASQVLTMNAGATAPEWQTP